MECRVNRTQDQLPTPRGCPQPAPRSAIALAIPQRSQAMEVAGDPAPWEVVGRPAPLTSSALSSLHLPLAAHLELAPREPLANT
jgi:hypothetical protein